MVADGFSRGIIEPAGRKADSMAAVSEPVQSIAGNSESPGMRQ
jgi:hypothetical protein